LYRRLNGFKCAVPDEHNQSQYQENHQTSTLTDERHSQMQLLILVIELRHNVVILCGEIQFIGYREYQAQSIQIHWNLSQTNRQFT